MRIKAKVGMNVHVFSPDKKKYLGKGECIKVEPLEVEETGEILTKDFPTFRLEDGTEKTGLECWWYPVED